MQAMRYSEQWPTRDMLISRISILVLEFGHVITPLSSGVRLGMDTSLFVA